MKYRSSISASIVSILAIQLAAVCFAQTDSSRQGDQKIVLGTSEVVVDVVVRDKKGRPVKDLSAADFEIYEDGAKQQIQSFQLHQRESGAAAYTAETKIGTNPVAPSHKEFAGANVIAFVFDHLSPS